MDVIIIVAIAIAAGFVIGGSLGAMVLHYYLLNKWKLRYEEASKMRSSPPYSSSNDSPSPARVPNKSDQVCF